MFNCKKIIKAFSLLSNKTRPSVAERQAGRLNWRVVTIVTYENWTHYRWEDYLCEGRHAERTFSNKKQDQSKIKTQAHMNYHKPWERGETACKE